MRRVLLGALLFDLAFGDPANRWHPVAWMGSAIYWLRKNALARGKFAYGGTLTVGGVMVVASLAALAERACKRLPAPWNWLARAYLLKLMFSLRGLDAAAAEVERALRTGDLPEARRLLSWHLVSRDVTTLSPSQVAAAAVESVAENTSDGIIAPLLWYAVGGLPAATAYRYVQTCDSVLGYRDAEREWLGKIPARADDALNLIPARLTALLFTSMRPHTWHVWRRDARVTASPNAGHSMSAMAGALGVELEKVEHYTLNAGARQPEPDDIRTARGLMYGAVGLCTIGLLLVMRNYND